MSVQVRYALRILPGLSSALLGTSIVAGCREAPAARVLPAHVDSVVALSPPTRGRLLSLGVYGRFACSGCFRFDSLSTQRRGDTLEVTALGTTGHRGETDDMVDWYRTLQTPAPVGPALKVVAHQAQPGFVRWILVR
jgi:hypothetical protein